MIQRVSATCLASLLCFLCLALAGCQFDQSVLEKQRCEPDAEVPECGPGQTCAPDGYCRLADVSSADVPETQTCGGAICAVGQSCCADSCVDTTRDAEHCGACGAACADGMTCRDGGCVCLPERDDCDGDASNGCEVRLTGFDPANCGACGNVCPDNMACISGSCLCQPGRVDCNDDLPQLAAGSSDGCEVDILSDANCGGCEATRQCEDGEVCEQGRCRCDGAVCVEGESCCDDSCTDTSTSQAHCGACGNKCNPGQICVEGSCVCPTDSGNQTCTADQTCCPDGCLVGACPSCGGTDCTDDQLCCDDDCKNSLTDPDNCGACGNICGEGRSCVGGTCVCDDGGEFCASAGVCIDTGISVEHCGGCDMPCAQGQSCCDGTCVDTSTSVAQCGACLADGGQQCSSGQACCNGTCRGLGSTSSCGACGNDCSTLPGVETASCADGTCQIDACESGLGDCDGDPSNGCEVDLSNDINNCGFCGTVCNSACEDYTCSCPSTGEDCAFGADCDANGRCRCGGGGQSCEWYWDGSRCDGNSCRCGDSDGRCDGGRVCDIWVTGQCVGF